MKWTPRVGLAIALLVAGCASPSSGIPETLRSEIDTSVSYGHLAASPDSYQGKMVLLGGEVLKAKRVADGTLLEVLQLPLDDGEEPTRQRMESQGRFLALDRSQRDPATFGDATRVTVVGEVTGATMGTVDESEYRYPMLTVNHLHVWPEGPPQAAAAVRPWWGVGFGMGGGRTGGGISIGSGF